MIRLVYFAAAIACMVGSDARAEVRAEVETGLLAQGLEPGSSSSLAISLLGEGREGVNPRGVIVKGLRFNTEIDDALNLLTNEDWSRVFPVSVASAKSGGIESFPPIAGKYAYRDEHLAFEPLYGFESGIPYLAEFKLSALRLRLSRVGVALPSSPASAASSDLEFPFSLDSAEKKGDAKVLAVFPSGSELPENLLKFYLHFSRPMSVGTHYQYIHLLREDGAEVRRPFLQLDEELWDPKGVRLTVLIDPGRIKSGLLPRGEVGAALEAGKSFRLVIDAAWPDDRGAPLDESYVKEFQVGAPDVESPTMSGWKLGVPSASTREAIVVSFSESLDHALLNRVVWVIDSSGNELEGEIVIGQGELEWRFNPRDPWRAGVYQLCAENSLEDIAGNSLGRLFEVDSFLTVSRRVERETLKRIFQVR